MKYEFTPIATVRSPYREKFSTPRQPGLTPTARSKIIFTAEFSSPEAVRELSEFSHIWLVFLFHQNYAQGWNPTVRPPRLGGNKRVGVFASRSPFRPNPVGLSAVKLLSVDISGGNVVLEVQGADLIDGTPILDIKPYIPYSDAIAEAEGAFADQLPERFAVRFSAQAQLQLERFSAQSPELEALVDETLALDPRPAYKRGNDGGREYGFLLDGYNIRWNVEEQTMVVLGIELAENS